MANIQLIKEVVAHIESKQSDYKRFDMDDFYRPFEVFDESTQENMCGTAMCFAGWAMDYKLGGEELARRRRSDLIISSESESYLELTDLQADRIFYECGVITIPQLKHLLNRVLQEEIFPEEEVDDQYVPADDFE